jgi:Transglutaminase-like superfamily
MAASVTDAFRRCRRDVISFARSSDRRTMIEAAGFLVLVRMGLWTLPFPALRAAIERIPPRARRPRIDTAADVGRIVDAVARRVPMPMTCLVEALAAKAMLRRRGRQATLHFGVRSGRIATPALDAHAWLVCDGCVVVGQLDDAEGYLTLEPAVREAGNAT